MFELPPQLRLATARTTATDTTANFFQDVRMNFVFLFQSVPSRACTGTSSELEGWVLRFVSVNRIRTPRKACKVSALAGKGF